jgi:hypothetical protein
MREMTLLKEEYDYLVNKLLKKHKKILSLLKFQENDSHSVVVELEEETVCDIRKLAGNEVRRLYFSKNHKPIRKDTTLEHLIDILGKIKIKVNLTKKEYDYLINHLLNGHTEIFSKLVFFEDSDNSINVELEADVADDIRELASDEVGFHFDENYEPTEEGWILEHFIDKFYTE